MKKLILICLALSFISCTSISKKENKQYQEYVLAKANVETFERLYSFAKENNASDEAISEIGDGWNAAKKDYFVKYEEFLNSLK